MIRPKTEAGKAMKKLVSALADYRDPLGPGVAIQRKGAVHDMFVETGQVSFEVEDGRERGFEVTIHASPANENIRYAVKDGRFHDLRRTFGLNLIKQGMGIYEVSKLLGHASVRTTEKHYAPLLVTQIRDFKL